MSGNTLCVAIYSVSEENKNKSFVTLNHFSSFYLHNWWKGPSYPFNLIDKNRIYSHQRGAIAVLINQICELKDSLEFMPGLFEKNCTESQRHTHVNWKEWNVRRKIKSTQSYRFETWSRLLFTREFDLFMDSMALLAIYDNICVF